MVANGLDGEENKSGCLEDQLVAATLPVSSHGNGDCLVAAPPPVHRSGHPIAGNSNKESPSANHSRKKTAMGNCWCGGFLPLKIKG